ncbi:protein FAM170A [Arvicola amphibius]|uniref:protein FAM170A n=1 Tax=Arvicola amphibius TaxID=1047088 RepID=UPI0018E35806|nr:protein FAM170A [Arvicola amphibius]
MKRRQKRKHLEIEESQEDDEKAEEISKSQDDVPQPESTGVAEAQNPGVGEVSSASKYFSCVSSPPKLVHRRTQKSQQDSSKPGSSAAQVPEGEATDATSQLASSSCPSYKTCVSSLCMNKDERGMKVYYMRVHVIKGVAISWDTSETSESLDTHPRMEEATLPESVWVGAPSSDVSTRNLLSDSEQSAEEKEHEERLELESPPESPMVEERPRAKTPDSLVTIENGYKCMACCRVYTTLDCLQQHVQNGLKEGFSCHVFHLVMSQIIGNVESGHTPQQQQDNNEKKEEHKEEKAEEQQLTEEDGAKKPWSQCPGCMFDSPKGQRRRGDHQDSSGSGQNAVSIKEDRRTNSLSNT